VSIDYAVIAVRFTRTHCGSPTRARSPLARSKRGLPALAGGVPSRMNTYATTGCCSATLPTMQDPSRHQPVVDAAAATCGICHAV